MSTIFFRRSICGLRPHRWGVWVVEIDRYLLEVGKLSVPVCAGLMPDGTFFRAPEEHAPPAVMELGRGRPQQPGVSLSVRRAAG